MTTEQAPLWFQNYVKQYENFVKQYETDTKRNFKEHADLANKVGKVDDKIEGLDSRFIGLERYVKDAMEGSPSPGL